MTKTSLVAVGLLGPGSGAFAGAPPKYSYLLDAGGSCIQQRPDEPWVFMDEGAIQLAKISWAVSLCTYRKAGAQCQRN